MSLPVPWHFERGYIALENALISMATLPMAGSKQRKRRSRRRLSLLTGTPVVIRAVETPSTGKGSHKPTVAVGCPWVLTAAAHAQRGAACVCYGTLALLQQIPCVLLTGKQPCSPALPMPARLLVPWAPWGHHSQGQRGFWGRGNFLWCRHSLSGFGTAKDSYDPCARAGLTRSCPSSGC